MPAHEPIAVLLSGAGRSLRNLFERIDAGELPARVSLVIASRECPGADIARERGVPAIVRPGVIPENELERALDDHGARWAACAGYLQYVRVPPRWRGRIINIHPALLPSFGGKGMHGMHVHRAVLDAGCKVSGCTVHIVDDEYDRGPILAQRCCPVLEGDTPETLAARVFEEERLLYPDALRALVEGRVLLEGGRARVRPR